MPEDLAPPVVAVVVTSDPGPWLEECLQALRDQDYSSLSILVVDANSAESLAPRVASVAPDIFLHRLSENSGFGPSANVVTSLVEGAAFYLFCHDDVVMAPDALRRLIEESFRSNAAIASPKLVDYDEPDRILQLGLGVDRFGAPIRRVERLEFDQAQHDEAREVFAVPGGVTLIRTDLFATLNGFDPEISMFGEDIDLCWRARLVGARIVVVPNAIVRHLEATSSRRRPLPQSRALQWRHELRAVLKNYGPARRAFVVTQLVILSLAEIVYFAAIGRRRRSKEVIEAWKWNLAAARDLKGARAAVMASRIASDHEISGFFSSRTSRIGRFARRAMEDVITRWHRKRDPFIAEGGRPRPHREQRPRAVVVLATIMVIVLVFGARALISGKLPLIGEFLPLPGPGHLLSNFFGGYTDAGMQRPGPTSPAFFLLGILGAIAFGGMGLVLKVGLIAGIAGGAFGTARFVRPFGSSPARLAAAVAYLFLPLAWNDLSSGDIGGLVAYAGLPWVCLRLFRATGVEPFVVGERLGVRSLRTLRECLWLGIIVAGIASFSPGLVVLTMFLSAAMFVACTIGNDRGAGARAAIVGVGSCVVAFVLCFPWSLTFIQPGLRWSTFLGASASPSSNPSLSALMRFQLGPIGTGILGWAFLASALFVVVAGRRVRFVWSVRMWIVGLASACLAWIASQGWLGSGGGALSVLLVPFGVMVAALVGLGVATFLADLRRVHFGWRHVAAALFALFAAAGLLPVLGATLPGRFSVPATGYDAVLSFTNSTNGPTSGQRVLWLGDPRTLPLPGWQITPGLSFGISEGGIPDMTRFWLSANPSVATGLEQSVLSTQAGLTVRLGRLLAPSGVRYIIVPTAIAPVLPGEQAERFEPPPVALVQGLSAQTDLRELPSEGGALVFENTVWRAGQNVPPILLRSGGTPKALRVIAVLFELALWSMGLLYVLSRRRRTRARHARRSHSSGRGHSAHHHTLAEVEELADLIPSLETNAAP